MTETPNDASRDGIVMKFGRAPNLLGIVGAVVGGAAVWWFGAELGFGPSPSGQLLAVLSGVVFGYGTGWLTGLILAMGFLGE